jgi:hypothetical protein
MSPIFPAWSSGRVSFLVIDLYLSSAVIVLLGARTLHGIGLLGPDGISLAVRWSERLIRRGMRIWHAEWARAAKQKTRNQMG